jgi:hypothetical protein
VLFGIPSFPFFWACFHPTWPTKSEGATTAFCKAFPLNLINSITFLTTSVCSAWIFPPQRIWDSSD